jgi:Tol biopolymer transport system component/tRNA A-37 threonylcarbamoyl transferase component Bud32
MSTPALDPARWRKVEEIYHEALEREPQERRSFVARACKDDSTVRREVETLLATEGKAAVVDQPAIEFAPELLVEDRVLKRGTELGPYRIEASIGSGGMGQVYRARDTRLNRTVALKISKEEFTQRFEHEARAVAALNHSHICQLYDIGPNYLIMEYVDGEPLRGPTRVDQAVRYGIEILDALEAAHREGVIHRDLKPANILISKQGVKLLDFGLAKQIGTIGREATTTRGLTVAGTIAGTLHYMSPEQLQGKTADVRSDLFSFGCVLYEMLTGKQAFQGETPASVIASVLEREPAPLHISPPLDRLVERCLAKDPDQRFQTATDLKTALAWASDQMPTVEPGRRWLRWAAVVAMCAASGAMANWGPWRAKPAEAARYAFTIDPSEGTGTYGGFSLSPDGRQIAVAMSMNQGRRLLKIRSLDSLTWRTLDVPYWGIGTGSWSPDGKYMAYTGGAKIRKLDLQTGVSQILCDLSGGGPPFTAWGANGAIVFSRQSGLWRVPASGGEPVQLTALDPKRLEAYHHVAQFLPDGKHFLYLISSRKRANSGMFVGSLESAPEANRRFILSVNSSGFYVPGANGGGFLLFEREGALMGQPFDASGLRVSGEPFMVAPEIGIAGSRPTVAVSQNGVIAFSASGAGTLFAQLAWFNRNGDRAEDVGPAGRYGSYAVAPEGKRIALQRTERDDTNVWILDAARGNSITRLTIDGGRTPVWSRDGKYIWFVKPSDTMIYRKLADGSGGEQQVGGPVGSLTSRAGDGRLLGTSVGRTWLGLEGKPLPTGQKPETYETSPRFSPDGEWIAYSSDQSRRQMEVYVRSAATDGPMFQVSTDGGVQPRWRADGKELFYIREDGKLMAVPVKLGDTFEFGTPVALFQPPVPDAPSSSGYDVSPDGQRFLLRTVPAGFKPSGITVLSHWETAVKQ